MKQALINAGKRMSDAVGKIFDGFMTMIERLGASPLKLVGVFVVVLIALDVFFKGNLGFAKYSLGLAKGIIATISAIKLEVLVVIAFIVVMIKKN